MNETTAEFALRRAEQLAALDDLRAAQLARIQPSPIERRPDEIAPVRTRRRGAVTARRAPARAGS